MCSRGIAVPEPRAVPAPQHCWWASGSLGVVRFGTDHVRSNPESVCISLSKVIDEFQGELMFESRRGISIERYKPEKKDVWDRFVLEGKNTSFLFLRDYMEYHADRFRDCSLLLYRAQRVIGVLPANLSDDNLLVSHAGLTYGGLVLRRDCGLREALEVFQACLEFIGHLSIDHLLYKRIPRFYNVLPDDEIDYALFLLGAELYRRDCALVVSLPRYLKFRKGRRSEIVKAKKLGTVVVEDSSFDRFWTDVLVPRLEHRFGVKPIHTLEEISLLRSRFPQHIRQYSAYHNDRIVAGVTIYETEWVAHAQYIGVTSEGQELGALDYLFSWLLDLKYVDKRYFDFGISNEQEGQRLNHGLLAWKESFGARSCVHDFYKVLVRNHVKLDAVLKSSSD